MATNARFYLAVHILVVLAMFKEELLTSEKLAASAGVNPVVVRRILGMLSRAGLVTAKLGAGGGCSLAEEPKTIRLSAVYRAVEQQVILTPHGKNTDCRCPVGKNIHAVMKDVADTVEVQVDKTLGKTTLAQMVLKIRNRGEKA